MHVWIKIIIGAKPELLLMTAKTMHFCDTDDSSYVLINFKLDKVRSAEATVRENGTAIVSAIRRL